MTQENGSSRGIRLFPDMNRGKYIPAYEADGKFYAEAVNFPLGYEPDGLRVGPRERRVLAGQEIEVCEIMTASAGGFNASRAPKPRNIPKDRNKKYERGIYLWKETPLGKTIVSLTDGFVFGKGLRYTCPGDVGKRVIQKWWRRNGMVEKAEVISNEHCALGDGFLLLTIIQEEREDGVGAGFVRATPISPDMVSGIEHDVLDVRDVQHYVVSYEDKNEADKDEKKTIKVKPIEKYVDGDKMVMARISANRSSKDVFGEGDLHVVDSWIENYQDYLWDSVLINRLYRSPMIDITIVGADDPEVKAALRRYRDFEIGSNPVHNDKETWKILEFTGANVSQQEARRALLLMIATGVQFPEFFFSDGANASLASSRSQLVPVIKVFEKRQKLWKDFWEQVFSLVLRIAAEKGGVGGIGSEVDYEGETVYPVEVRFPPLIFASDDEVTRASRVALEDGYMSLETAASRMSIDLELESAAREKEAEVGLEHPTQKQQQPPGTASGAEGDGEQKKKDDPNPTKGPSNPTE